jgi:hypothetical protein
MSVSVAISEIQSSAQEFIYLCQIDETVSCSACCGVYNIKDLSERRLEAMLASRTEAFASVARTEDGLYAFQHSIERSLPRKKPFLDFYHCPYVGFIGSGKSRIGCLLHPNADGNEGKDYRRLSWYGATACRNYFCPSHQRLVPTYRMIVREAMNHWYLYGLIVTEHRLLTAFFREIETRIARRIVLSDFTENSEVRTIFREFAGLKVDWPFRRKNAPGPCNFVFDNGEYLRPNVQRANPEIPFSGYEDLFQELDSGFQTTDELLAAQTRLDDLFTRLASLLTSQSTTSEL